ncbi:MAG: Wzz/FepE/Etk N-terminal domain-containing protein [Gemmatimonadota bacterium]
MPTLQSSSAEQWQQDNAGTASLLRLANLALRQIKLILLLAITFGVLAFVYATLQPQMYTSAGSFMVQTSKTSLGTMPGIAAQLGVSLPSTDPSQSPSFYSELLETRFILGTLVDTTFQYRALEGGVTRTTVADAYHVRANPAPIRRDDAIERLSRAVSVRVSQKSGMVTYAVEAPAPDLARTLADALLNQLVRFNMLHRQSRAAAERKFTEGRLAEVGVELRAAEQQHEAFLRENRSVTNSPQLNFQDQRLARQVELRRTLYSTLAESYEQAKIEEVRDTPQISVIEAPEIPARPDARLRIGKAVVAALFGALLALLIGFSKERFTEVGGSTEDEAAEFRRLRQATMDALLHPFRSGRRARTGA